MPKRVRLLLAEDDAGDAEMVKRMLAESPRSHWTIEWVTSLEEAIETLATGRFDLLLLDLGLPGARDLEALFKIQSLNIAIPVIIVTGHEDETLALRALQIGAQDYLLKGHITSDGLVRSIRFATERHRLLRQVSEAQMILTQRNHRLSKLYRTAYKFVDNVSHEFRTPLTVIKEYASIIRDGLVGVVTEEQRQMLTVVEDRADDLNVMVDDMLDVSRLEAGLLGVYRAPCSAADIVARVRPALERKAAARSVRLEWEIDADLPLTYCDASKAGRVLINLTINAIKFCGQPGHVRLSCHKCPSAPGLEFRVTDNGRGISAEDQGMLFRRFKQLSESPRGSTKGFGLGLSIAKDLVEENLGEIHVESEPNRGSTFSFTLPSAEPAEVMGRFLARIARRGNNPPYLSLVEAAIAESATQKVADDVDGFLSCLLRHNDLALRVARNRWAIVLTIAESEFPAFQRRTDKAIDETRRNRVDGVFPEIDYRFWGTWNGGAHAEIMAKLGAVMESEVVECI